MSVILFERNVIGGTCLNRGCVPTKYLLHVARKYCEARQADVDGISIQSIELDYSKTKKRLEEIISSLREGLLYSLDSKNIDVVLGNAVIKEHGVIECEGKEYKTKNIIIATGSISKEPVVKGAKVSDDIFEIDYIPDKLSIIGGGTIAMEFAEIYRMFGSDVSISVRGDRILSKWDKEIAFGLTQSFKKKGIKIKRNTDCALVPISTDEMVISVVGRISKLPEAKVSLFDIGEKGGILVDKNGETRTKGIFAAGDVIEGSEKLAHIAMEQGRRIVRFIANKHNNDEGAVIKCIYLDQEVATVGMTADEAEEHGIATVTAKQTMFSNARSLISIGERGFIKVIADKYNRKIIGAQLMCEHAGEIVAEFALAINQGMTVNDMMFSVRPHPSYCETVTEVLRILEDKLNEV